MSNAQWVEAAILVACLLASGVAAAAHTSLLQFHRSRLRHLAQQTGVLPPSLGLLREPASLVPLLGTVHTLALLGAGISAMLLAIQESADRGLAAPGPALPVGVVMAALAVQLVARVLAVRWPEATARLMLRAAGLFYTVLAPVALPIVLLERGALALIGGGHAPNSHTDAEEEIIALVEDEKTELEKDEREMILGIVEMSERTVREVMVPRIDMVAVEKSAPVAEVLDIIVSTGHSRVPVYSDNVDNIEGIAYAKDLLRHLRDGTMAEPVGKLARPAYFVPETKRIDELLRELQKKKVHMAVVLDEYGGTAGLITIEDLLEEIVGEIQDEYDLEEESSVEKLSDDEAIFDARVSITMSTSCWTWNWTTSSRIPWAVWSTSVLARSP